jgi:hypothetical protein
MAQMCALRAFPSGCGRVTVRRGRGAVEKRLRERCQVTLRRNHMLVEHQPDADVLSPWNEPSLAVLYHLPGPTLLVLIIGTHLCVSRRYTSCLCTCSCDVQMSCLHSQLTIDNRPVARVLLLPLIRNVRYAFLPES